MQSTTPSPGTMSTDLLFVAFVAVVLFGVFVWDRSNHRKARRISSSWNCFRCGANLDSMQSVFIRVAGGPGSATSARVCQSCAKRDSRIWWAGIALVTILLIATGVFVGMVRRPLSALPALCRSDRRIGVSLFMPLVGRVLPQPAIYPGRVKSGLQRTPALSLQLENCY